MHVHARKAAGDNTRRTERTLPFKLRATALRLGLHAACFLRCRSASRSYIPRPKGSVVYYPGRKLCHSGRQALLTELLGEDGLRSCVRVNSLYTKRKFQANYRLLLINK